MRVGLTELPHGVVESSVPSDPPVDPVTAALLNWAFCFPARRPRANLKEQVSAKFCPANFVPLGSRWETASSRLAQGSSHLGSVVTLWKVVHVLRVLRFGLFVLVCVASKSGPRSDSGGFRVCTLCSRHSPFAVFVFPEWQRSEHVNAWSWYWHNYRNS